MSHGPYDPATQFLLDTMHDPSVSILHRVECAAILLKLNPQEFNVRMVHDPDAPTITIVIGGMGPPTTVQGQDQGHITQDPIPPLIN
jgi:hypothetical protein